MRIALRSQAASRPRAHGRVPRRRATAVGPLEDLEERLLLSYASAENGEPPVVMPAWFGRPNAVAVRALDPDPEPAAEVSVPWGGRTVQARRDEWVVRITAAAVGRYPTVPAAQALFDAAPFPAHIVQGLGLAGTVLVRTPGAPARAVEQWLSTQTAIASFEPNAVLHTRTAPRDPRFGDQWSLNNTGQAGGKAGSDIDAPEAWDLTTGSRSVVVAVIDTGVDYTHPDLKANMWTNPGEVPDNGKDDDGDGFVDDVHGYDFVNDDSDPMDDDGHGTHVAGSIAAAGDNRVGVVGVAWSSSLMALKAIDQDGNLSLAAEIRAIDYVTMMRSRYGVNVRVINNSYGGPGAYPEERDAIARSALAGLLFVAAAGNAGADNDGPDPSYPASYDSENVLSVAATDASDALAGYSNYGRTSVDLAAPGGDGSLQRYAGARDVWFSNRNVLSTYPTALDTHDGSRDGYTYQGGTSMAAPHVTGVAALAWSLVPGASVQAVRDAILSGVDRLGSLADKVATGGRLNARRTLEKLFWETLPGTARQVDVGVKGHAWIISTRPAAGGHLVMSWDGRQWQSASAGAEQVAVAPDGAVWAVQNDGTLLRRDPVRGVWGQPAKTEKARAIDIGSNGSVWILSQTVVNPERPGSEWIYALKVYDGDRFVPFLGAASALGVGPDGAPYAVVAGPTKDEHGNAVPTGSIFHLSWARRVWELVPAPFAATDIDVGPLGQVWAVGTPRSGGPAAVYAKNLDNTWTRVGGVSPSAIAVGPGGPWVVESGGGLARRRGDDAAVGFRTIVTSTPVRGAFTASGSIRETTASPPEPVPLAPAVGFDPRLGVLIDGTVLVRPRATKSPRLLRP